jgi:hypothetical protein
MARASTHLIQKESPEMEATITAPRTRGPGTGRIVAATLVGLLALVIGAAGATGIWALTAKSDGSYVSTDTHRYASSGRAIVSDPLHVGSVPDWLVARVRITTSSSSSQATFVGVGPKADVDRYLAGVEHSTIEDVNYDPFNVSYGTVAGSAVPARPAAQRFWAESATGKGTQTLTWKVREGQWRVVVMNADGSPNVTADAKVGASVAHALVYSLVLLGLALGIGAVAVLVVRGHRS